MSVNPDWQMPDTVPAGQHYLARDHRAAEWSLWRRADDLRSDHMLVGWDGQVSEPPHVSISAWDWDRYSVQHITPDDASLLVMGARHLTSQESWCAYVQRHVDRFANRRPSCQII